MSPTIRPFDPSRDGAHPLRTDGALEIFFIGVGNAFSSRLGHTNLLVVKGDDHLLVDVGTTAPDRLLSVAGLEQTAITTILPTHQHADHIGGLESLLIQHRYRSVVPHGRPRPRLIMTPALHRAAWEMTLRGGLGFNEEEMDGRIELLDLYAEVLHPEPVAGATDTWRIAVGSLSIELFPTRHVIGADGPEGLRFLSYGLLIDDAIFFSADTRFDRALIDRYADRARFWIHEASPIATAVHASIDELRTLPEEIRSSMLLSHYPDGLEATEATGFFGWARPGVRYLFA